MTNLTKHGYERIKERLGIKSVSKAERIVELARERGKRFDFTENKTNRLIRYIKRKEEKTNDIYATVFNGAVYLFSKETDMLVTVYHLANEADAFYKKTAHIYKRSDFLSKREAMAY